MMALQGWYWRSLPLENRTGSDVFARLFLKSNDGSPEAIATLLESPANRGELPLHLSRYSICAGSPRWMQGKWQFWTPEVGEILPFLRLLLSTAASGTTAAKEESSLPFLGGWLGWLGYDLAWEIESLPSPHQETSPFPVAYWYEPDCFAIADHYEQRLWLAATRDRDLDTMETRLASTTSSLVVDGSPAASTQPQLQMSAQAYADMVVRAKQYIQAGDIFQTNLSLRFETQTSASSWATYQALQQINPSPFASYWQTPWGSIVSCSPERLVQVAGNSVQTRPIAGTRSRGSTPAEDEQLARQLYNNVKERAEHVMLVDLERNDLGRVCQWGSVVVDELMAIERYSHVMHLVSNVRGILASDRDAVNAIAAMFPGGTITGCPKVRCMEIIAELEPVRRHLFYGSCGYLDWRGHLDLNILIRTLLWLPQEQSDNTTATVWGQVGAGIVADSDPQKEWQECLHKAQAQLQALRWLPAKDGAWAIGL
ncbi:anthranilate synthase component I [Geitlerinema sp. PCC 9228]|uniref:anthranilate synthase component I n=1 Tax=Geitlerinema sp. PCC 9228 TaxID=111611 RepID=UPI0008F9B184|nr:anthranilate synthase component I [Geitlerinema sp. PCC 9228]